MLKVKLAAAEQRVTAQDARIEQLEKLLADYKRALFGSRSEKIHPDQVQLQLEELETTIAVEQAEAENDSQLKPKANGS
ncbi:transposase [Flexibacterium corallicola]|uniref:transposase n=1 Tax=Flexibacterium corallicola TaxID=3037259 RepID=UPI00286F4717|nr:transposase [Pseudovibrio sp. M1P-2-3]